MAKKKFHKFLTKRCPECGGRLQSVEYQVEENGVLYSENCIECTECDYCEELKNNKHRQKDKTDMEW